MNPYLYGCVILLFIWAIVFLVLRWRRMAQDLREFWWSSFTCALLGFSEPLFVPEYWSPPSILSVGRWDLESFIFCFAIGGIAAVLPEFPNARRAFLWLDYQRWIIQRGIATWLRRLLTSAPVPDGLADAPRSEVRLTKRELTTENMLLVALFLGTFGFTAHLGLNVIYDAALTCTAMAFFIGWRRPKLRWQILGGGFSFLWIYAVVLRLVGMKYPSFYVEHWNLKDLSGGWFLGAPVEEYLFAFTLGVFWAPLYEAWKDVRLAARQGPAAVPPLQRTL